MIKRICFGLCSFKHTQNTHVSHTHTCIHIHTSLLYIVIYSIYNIYMFVIYYIIDMCYMLYMVICIYMYVYKITMSFDRKNYFQKTKTEKKKEFDNDTFKM